jgi:hypothetical protein
MKVFFSNSGSGPYTIHTDGDRLFLISHRGPIIHNYANNEEDLIKELRKRIGIVRVEEYANNILAYTAILDDLKEQSKVLLNDGI